MYQCNILQEKFPDSVSGIYMNCAFCVMGCLFLFSELTWERLYHVRCTICNCQNNVFVYLTWPLKARNNGVLMQTCNKKKMYGILFSRINSLH